MLCNVSSQKIVLTSAMQIDQNISRRVQLELAFELESQTTIFKLRHLVSLRKSRMFNVQPSWAWDFAPLVAAQNAHIP